MTDYLEKVSSSELFRTLLRETLKVEKNHKKREKLSKNFGSLRDLNPGPVGKIGNSV